MLSRIRPEIATQGDYEYRMEGFTDPPIQVDGFDLNKIREQQRLEFSDLITEAGDEQSSYVLIDGLLYREKRPEATAAIYPRLVLPSCYYDTVIKWAQIVRQIRAEIWRHCGFLRTSMKLGIVVDHNIGNVFRRGATSKSVNVSLGGHF